ncbi:hypothetical protein G6L68_25275 [Agrobacterium fabrum]|uniref:hypothetical protein n=1 Tax=Agrobacterium fabrum TaxID=1176649 RepID=UPI000F0CF8CA|nr:hypothetical protein [Agrobacterium fabrum]AYM66199.1 hypothetical protein At12D13_50470 [Agrobacterium fabrum]NTE63946.1 hypothetical protein [Agrobacterium fabrum]
MKEKMGGLRLYYDLGKMSPEAEQAIQDASDRAEARSHSICEECGQRGHLSSRLGYLTAVCDFHADIGEVKAVLVEQGPYLLGGANGWLRYDFDLDAFVDVEPLKGAGNE